MSAGRENWWYISFGDFTGRGGVFSADTAEGAVAKAGADLAKAAAIGPLPPGTIPEGHPLNVTLTVEEVQQYDPDHQVNPMSRNELLAMGGSLVVTFDA